MSHDPRLFHLSGRTCIHCLGSERTGDMLEKDCEHEWGEPAILTALLVTELPFPDDDPKGFLSDSCYPPEWWIDIRVLTEEERRLLEAGKAKLQITIRRIAPAERHTGGPVKFSDWWRGQSLRLQITERRRLYRRADGADAWFAQIVSGEIKEPTGGLRGTGVVGRTSEEAVQKLAHSLRGQLLIIDADRESRREIECPNEWEPE